MQDKKRIAISVVGFICVIVGIYFIGFVYGEITRAANVTFNLFPVLLVQRLFPLLFAVAVRVPALISRWQENRSFDWIRFVFQVVPGLFILGQPLFSVLFSVRLIFPAFTQGVFVTFLSFWVGTVLIDCIKGKNATISEQTIGS